MLTRGGISEKEKDRIRNGGNRSWKCAKKPAMLEDGFIGILSFVVAKQAEGDLGLSLGWSTGEVVWSSETVWFLPALAAALKVFHPPQQAKSSETRVDASCL